MRKSVGKGSPCLHKDDNSPKQEPLSNILLNDLSTSHIQEMDEKTTDKDTAVIDDNNGILKDDHSSSLPTPSKESSALNPGQDRKGTDIALADFDEKDYSPKKVPSTNNLPDNVTAGTTAAGDEMTIDNVPAVINDKDSLQGQ